MDFFAHQENARKKTRYLVVLFILALVLIILMANLLLAAVMWASSSQSPSELSSYFSLRIFGQVSAAVAAVVILAIVYKWLQIGGGGRGIAESLGGTRLLPDSAGLLERRALNVVEEMALASGMIVPPVYILEKEMSVNAFAAGNNPSNAVIGITRGCLEQLNREQLQGVIAHEFSHILNGDMRLNLRLIALLNGILFLGNCGRFLLYSNSRSSVRWRRSGGSGRLFLLALVLSLVGWIGTFFGSLIKAAINRQREFLADASAVQFTRNPQGIAGALKVIGGMSKGSKLTSYAAAEASHLFIADAMAGMALFTTHPPLSERIRRIEPGWDGRMEYRKAVEPAPSPSGHEDSDAQRKKMVGTAILGSTLAGAAHSRVSAEEKKLSTFSQKLQQALKEPFGASTLLYGFLLNGEKTVKHKQTQIIAEIAPAGSVDASLAMQHELQGIDESQHIILVEKALPALRGISRQQYLALRKCLRLLIQADGKVDLFEWCMYQMVRLYLGADFGDRRKNKARYSNINDLGEHYCAVISTLLHHFHNQPQTLEKAFARGVNSAGLYTATLLTREECTIDRFITGVNGLADAYPLLKARILKGLHHAVTFDGQVLPMERELVGCIAALMESPVPRFEQ